MKNIAIFASGSGTNAENIIRYFFLNETVRVALVVSNKSGAAVHEKAAELQVPSFTFGKDDLENGLPIADLLNEHRIDFIVLAGFLAKIPDLLLKMYPDRIVNIHPSLLPKFGGKGMYGLRVHEAVLAAGETETGITIHYINEKYDQGEIVCQKRCPVMPSDTPEELAARVHALEYRYYPEIIEQLVHRIS